VFDTLYYICIDKHIGVANITKKKKAESFVCMPCRYMTEWRYCSNYS